MRAPPDVSGTPCLSGDLPLRLYTAAEEGSGPQHAHEAEWGPLGHNTASSPALPLLSTTMFSYQLTPSSAWLWLGGFVLRQKGKHGVACISYMPVGNKCAAQVSWTVLPSDKVSSTWAVPCPTHPMGKTYTKE